MQLYPSLPRHVLGACLVAALVLSGLSACQPSAAKERAPDVASRIERGAYLVTVLACDDCHSPKVFTDRGPAPDPARRLSGHPGGALPEVPAHVIGPEAWGAVTSNDMTVWVGPWGTSFAANITPHPDGIGLWTEEQFVQSLRTGLHLGVGRPVLPPMPWPAYKQLTDEDLRSVFAYLKTLQPIANVVPPPQPPSGP